MRLSEHVNNQIDRTKKLEFTFNNKKYYGFYGDTLASALIANDCLFLARSFKYGRKRGIISAGVEEPNALVSLEEGAYYTPNLKVTEIMLYDGLKAVSASKLDGIDFRAFIKPLHRFMPAGFYYKTFIKQKYWAKVENYIRKFSGFSKPPTKEDKEYYDYNYHYCDILIIGGGVAGMSSAIELLKHSAKLRVTIVDERAVLGGETLADVTTDVTIDNWYKQSITELFKFAKDDTKRVTLLSNTTAFAWHDDNYIQALEKVSDNISPKNKNHNIARQILHKIRAKYIILATGAHERPMLFANNDLINIMLSQSIKRYVNEFSVVSGKKIILYGNNDSIYTVAKQLVGKHLDISVIDVRGINGVGDLLEELKSLGVKLLSCFAIIRAEGKHKITKVVIANTYYKEGSWLIGRNYRTIHCDLLGTSGGFNPVIHLDCHTGSTAYFDENTQSFLPKKT